MTPSRIVNSRCSFQLLCIDLRCTKHSATDSDLSTVFHCILPVISNQHMPPTPNHARLSTSRRRIFHVNARRLLEHSTVHGLSHVSSASSHVGRVTWFVLFVAGIAGFCINLSLIVSRYVSRPVLTSIFNDHDEFVWPDITICNPSAPYVVHLYDRQEKWLRLRDWAKNVAQYIPSELFAAIDEADKVEIKTQALMHSTMSPSDFGVGIPNETVNFVAADTGHHGIVLTVELDGNLTYLSAPMEQYFRTHILQKRYNIPCYTLQIEQGMPENERKRVRKVALGLKFNIESHMIINTSYVSPTLDFIISRPGHMPHDEPLELLPGYMHYIGLNFQRFKREPSKRPCRNNVFDVEVFDANLATKYPVHGSATLCHRILSQNLYIKYCGCYSPFLPYPVIPNHPDFDDSPVLCFNMSRFKIEQLSQNAKCMFNLLEKYRDPVTYMNIPEAQECEYLGCVPPCEDIEHQLIQTRRTPLWELWSEKYNDARLSFLKAAFQLVFEVDIVQNRLGKSFHINNDSEPALRYLRENFALVTIERKVEKGELIREDLEYPLAELLSDIGGLMGLWIGISVIGLFEVLELLGLMSYTVVEWLTARLRSKPAIRQNKNAADRRYSINSHPAQWDKAVPKSLSTDPNTMKLTETGELNRLNLDLKQSHRMLKVGVADQPTQSPNICCSQQHQNPHVKKETLQANNRSMLPSQCYSFNSDRNSEESDCRSIHAEAL